MLDQSLTEAKMNEQQQKALFDGVYWHQRWEIVPGIFTPGRNPVIDLLSVAGLPEKLAGKRILDIGAWNGCISFECERRGAADILAIGPENPEVSGFNRLKSLSRSRRVSNTQPPGLFPTPRTGRMFSFGERCTMSRTVFTSMWAQGIPLLTQSRAPSTTEAGAA